VIGSIALALFAAAQASTLHGEARCITDQFTAAEKAELATVTRQNADPSAQLGSRLEDVGARCAESRGWTPESAPPIIGLAIATILRDEYGPQLRRVGVDPAAVDAWLARQSEELRANPVIQRADAERLALDLHQAGIPMPTLEAHGELLGAYVAARLMVERTERGLPLE
jgi:hypothetical protein